MIHYDNEHTDIPEEYVVGAEGTHDDLAAGVYDWTPTQEEARAIYLLLRDIAISLRDIHSDLKNLDGGLHNISTSL